MPFKKIPHVCPICQKTFMSIPKSLYCGPVCVGESKRGEQVSCQCKTCGKEFFLRPCDIADGQGSYCSKPCKYEDQRELPEDHFWRLWDEMEKPEDPEACWLWPGSKFDRGYARLKHEGKTYNVRRMALQLHGVSLQETQYACHKCDTPPCIRVHPLHLYAGSPQENIDDRDNAGHTPMGEKHWKRKLTEQQVKDIRATWRAAPKKFGLLSALGRYYGVKHSMIANIVGGKNWTYLPLEPLDGAAQTKIIEEINMYGQGERNAHCQLSDHDIATIRHLRATGVSVTQLADRYRVSETHIYGIIKRDYR